LRKPNPNGNLTVTLKLTLTPALTLTLILTLTLNKPNPIASALRDLPNIAQFVKCCAIDKFITVHLVKCAIDQVHATTYIEHIYVSLRFPLAFSKT